MLEDLGPKGLPLPEGVTLYLLIWPQDDNAVPPGMESLISAPLVKTSEKEEEQVGLWEAHHPQKLEEWGPTLQMGLVEGRGWAL